MGMKKGNFWAILSFVATMSIVIVAIYDDVRPPPPVAADCVPMSLQFLGDYYGYMADRTTWVALCHTGPEGTDISNVEPAWDLVTCRKSPLIPIYVTDTTKVGETAVVANELNAIKAHNYEPDRPIVLFTRLYLWVGVHQGLGSDSNRSYGHCAVIYFTHNTVHMINPNSLTKNGLPLEEDFSYKDFFAHTFVVFDVDAK